MRRQDTKYRSYTGIHIFSLSSKDTPTLEGTHLRFCYFQQIHNFDPIVILTVEIKLTISKNPP
jgi:hypothetical protein